MPAFAPVLAPRWTRKPPPGTDLDRAHPRCPDHAWPFLSPQGTAQALWKAAPLAAPSTRGDIYAAPSTFVAGRKYGWAVRHGGTADQTRLTASLDSELNQVVPLAGGWTLLLCYRKTDTTLRASAAIGTSTASAGTECTVFLPYSDGVVYFDFGGSVAGTTRLSVSGLSFGDDLWVFTTGARGMEIWQNGLRRAANSANPTRTAVVAGNALVLGPFGNFGDLAETALVLSWRRQLPAAAIQSLSVNPWQVFQPRGDLRLATATAAALPTTVPRPFPALTLAP